jgi:predicted ATP-grasp superfamily ATP-dependent carboligase
MATFSCSAEYCVIVDGYSTGKYYPSYFNKAGFLCIHVESGTKLPYPLNRNDYVELIEKSEDLQATLKALENYSISCVVPGAESGVELAEELCLALHLPSNTTGCAKLCRDKFLTGEKLKEFALPSVKQIQTNDVDQALDWCNKHNCWPKIVKPIDSAGSDGFHFCQNEEEIQAAMLDLLGKTNFLGKTNSQVLIQEYLKGDEYIVNTVSCGSSHYIQSFMVYQKKETDDGGLTFENYSLLKPSDCPKSAEIFAYALNVLDALGIKNGPSHLEIILTEEGPILVECNGRPHGHSFPDQLMLDCLGQTQIELSVLAFIDPETFYRKTQYPYELEKYMSAVHLISTQEGFVDEVRFLEEIEQLPSFYLHRILCPKGSFIKKTVDLLSSPGDVFLCSEKREQLVEDEKKIRAFEKEGIFSRCRSAQL